MSPREWLATWKVARVPALLVLALSGPVAAEPFTDIGAGLPGTGICSVAWGDYDNDGEPDLAISGYISIDPHAISRIYHNDAGVFTDIGAGLTPVSYGALAWGDYDNDGDLDLASAGDARAQVYRNDAGAFTNVGAGLQGVSYASLAWGDYDNDGDLDLVLTGRVYGGSVPPYKYPVSILYRNDGGVFRDSGVVLAAVELGSVAWGDYDNDGDLDLALAGASFDGSYHQVSKVYRNDGGAFIDIGASLTGVEGCSLAWGDYDNDGDLDLALAGKWIDSMYHPVSQIYRNEAGVFTDINAGLTGVYDCSLAWGDFDNDGDLDLALAGMGLNSVRVCTVYRNDGNGAFADINAGLPGVSQGSLAWGDYDGDGDLDLALAGYSSGAMISRVYRNNGGIFNTPPAAPGGLGADRTGGGVVLRWEAAGDSQTPSASLSYNVRVGTSPGAGDVCSGMADLSSGRRRTFAIGNAQQRLAWTLRGLSYGTYYWSAQAIDSAFAGSPWADEGVVVVPAPSDFDTDGDVDLDDFAHFSACFNGPNRSYAEVGCGDADLDVDADVDLTDFGAFRSCFNGPNRRPACP